MYLKWGNALSENKHARFWDMAQPICILLHPLKTTKPFSGKQESWFGGLAG
jgi:hypothetical protein